MSRRKRDPVSKISVDFPKNFAFGKVYLAKPAVRNLSLRNVYNIDLPFEIEIIEPHPYFHVDPCLGTIPAGESVVIKVTYKPITFGSSAMALRLSIKLEGVVPKDCVVSARAVSGLIEKEALVQAQQRIQQCLADTTTRTNSTLSNTGSTYRFDVTRLNTANGSMTAGSFDGGSQILGSTRAVTAPMPRGVGTSDFSGLEPIPMGIIGSMNGVTAPGSAMSNRRPARDRSDPAAALLAVTFKGAANTFEALSKTIALQPKPIRRFKPGDEIPPLTDIVDNTLLGSKVIDATTGKRVPKAIVCPRPRGLGAGNVFDAGAEWMSNRFHQKHLRRLKLQAKERDAANVSMAAVVK